MDRCRRGLDLFFAEMWQQASLDGDQICFDVPAGCLDHDISEEQFSDQLVEQSALEANLAPHQEFVRAAHANAARISRHI